MTVKQLTVLRPGSTVHIGGQPGIITQVCVTSDFAVSYEVVWWSAADRKSAWVRAEEIETSREKMKFGFEVPS